MQLSMQLFLGQSTVWPTFCFRHVDTGPQADSWSTFFPRRSPPRSGSLPSRQAVLRAHLVSTLTLRLLLVKVGDHGIAGGYVPLLLTGATYGRKLRPQLTAAHPTFNFNFHSLLLPALASPCVTPQLGLPIGIYCETSRRTSAVPCRYFAESIRAHCTCVILFEIYAIVRLALFAVAKFARLCRLLCST